MEIKAQSKMELARALSSIDISVSPRREGRTNDQVEKWVMYRTLSTLLANDFIGYPMSLQKRQRPDYLLTIGNIKTGCEITEAINSEYLKAQSLPEAEQEGAVLDVSLFKWGAKKRRLNMLREIASKVKLTGPAWAGNTVEMEYAQIVYDVVLKKTISMQKPGYALFEKNDVLIYCNQSLPILDIIEGATLCSKKLSDYWSPTSFNRVFVEKGEKIVMYPKDQFLIMEINDLWGNGS